MAQDKVEHSPHYTLCFAKCIAEEYGQPLQKYLRAACADHVAAQDVAQDVYLRMLQMESCREVRNPKAYAFRVAANLLYDRRQAQLRERVTFDSEAVEQLSESRSDPHAEHMDLVLDREQQLKILLARMPPLHLRILLMRKHDGMSLPEIAQALGLSGHTVKKYLYQAVAKCKALNRAQQDS